MGNEKKSRLAVRGTLHGALVFDQRFEIHPDDDLFFLDCAKRHYDAMVDGVVDMVEIEFLDDPSPARFFRIGTNPAGMVLPVPFRG